MNRFSLRRLLARGPATSGLGLLLGAGLLVACGDEGSDPEPAEDAGVTLDAGVADAASPADTGTDEPEVDPAELWADFAPAPPPVPRLTRDQLDNALRDLLGDDLVIPDIAWDDLVDGGFAAVGAGSSALSPRTAEDLERSAAEMARQALSEERRARLVSCEPAGTVDDACADTVLRALGRRAWRRSLSDDEAARLVAVSRGAAETLGDFYAGLEYGVSAVLQSPHFLYRREVGVPDEATGWRRYTDLEMASRLAFTLWNTLPDDALLDAAESGTLSTDEGLRAEIRRMLDDERSREGLLTFFRQWFELDELLHLSKDPQVFSAMSPELGTSARMETLLGIEHLVFDLDADFREILTTNRSFVDRRLAALYGIPAPSRDGFGETYLPTDGLRRGLLGQAAFLSLHSHPVSSSATLRGLFVRETLLCSPVGAPPSDVDTSIPEPSGEAPTLRERVAEHLEAETCRGCHLQMDPIGLAFENFDGVGRFREFDTRGGLDNPARIDPSGDLDGIAFEDAWDLGELVATHPRFGRCVAQSWMRYGTGTIEGLDQFPGVLGLTAELEQSEFRILDMVERFLMSPAFRYAGEIVDEDTVDAEEVQP